MVWLGARRGHTVDWATQQWVRWTGEQLSLADYPWLTGPIGSVEGIGADFFERWAEHQGLDVVPAEGDDGLLPGGLAELDGPAFASTHVHSQLDGFYRHTARYQLRIRSRWSGVFRAVGWLVAWIFARRLAQLNIPMSDRELRGGVDSRMVRLADSSGPRPEVGWIRTAVQTGLPVFVGQYGVATIPGHDGPCIKVVFPLPNGNAIVLLRPRVEPDGGLALVSDGRRLGEPGFYFTVAATDGGVWVRYVRTMKEQLRLRVEADAIVGTHRFTVFGLPFVELSYRISRASE